MASETVQIFQVSSRVDNVFDKRRDNALVALTNV